MHIEHVPDFLELLQLHLKSIFFVLVVHSLYLVNRSSNEDEIAQEYRETILLSKYLLE